MLKGGFCETKELIPGNVYYGTSKYYNDIWLKLYSTCDLLEKRHVNELNKHVKDMIVTKKIKKVRPIENIGNEKDIDIKYNVRGQIPMLYNYIMNGGHFSIVGVDKLSQMELDWFASNCGY